MALTALQKKAIAALLTSRTTEEAAQKAGCSARSIYKWLAEDADFKRELTAAEGQAIDNATRQLVALQNSAIAVFAGILDNPGLSPSLRLRAAVAALDLMLRLRDAKSLEERIARLEKELYERKTPTS